MNIWDFNKPQHKGKSKFAGTFELLNSNLKGNGIVFGKAKSQILVKPPNIEGNVLLVGAPGTGKSSAVIIPSLLNWEGSALCFDIKGEISRITKEKREKNNNIIIFDPESPNCDKYNPIRLCNTVAKAQELARTLIPVPKEGDPYWATSAQSVFAAFVYKGYIRNVSLTKICRALMGNSNKKIVEYLKKETIPEVKRLASNIFDLGDKTLGSIMSQLRTNITTLANDRAIENATNGSDWSPRDLENNTTIYIKVSEAMLRQYKDLWTIIINQIINYLMKRPEYTNPPILLALDELPRLGRINSLMDALATLRSRNTHLLLSVQSLAQLDSIYGKTNRKIIADNSSYKLILSAGDPETQRYFSNLAGRTTVKNESVTKEKKSLLKNLFFDDDENDKPKVSTSYSSEPLIRAEEFGRIPEGKGLLFAKNHNPINLKLQYWFT